MIEYLVVKIKTFFNATDQRSSSILKNTIVSFFVKGGSIVVGFLLVPLTINYISATQYGIWLTISSMVTWISFFDVGLGNGLRNNLAISMSKNDHIESKVYISTTYAILSIIAIFLLILFKCVNFFIPWHQFLNIPEHVLLDISNIMFVVISCFCVQFIVQIINVVLTATHKSSIANLISFISQLILLIVIFILKHTIEGKLGNLVWALTCIPLFVQIVSSIILYKTSLKHIAPGIKFIDFSYVKKILSIGGTFFVIQIGTLVLFQTDNIILTRVIGPNAVTEFNIGYKLFSVIIMVFTIFIVPYWSAFTDAYAREDYVWMRSTMKKLRKFWIYLSLIGIPIIFLLSPFLYKVWIGNAVTVSTNLSLSLALYVIGYTGMMLNCYFLNGVGKIKLQLYLYLFVIIFNIPLSLFLSHQFGVVGVVLSNVILFFIMEVVFWIQCNKILYEKAYGVWNK